MSRSTTFRCSGWTWWRAEARNRRATGIACAAGIRNLDALADAVFGVNARAGLPDGVDVLPSAVSTPEFVPVLGVVHHGFEYRAALRSGRIEARRSAVSSALRSVGGLFSKYFF